jgi:hypothetical protein
MSRRRKLERMEQIAQLKATLAKGDAARTRAEADALLEGVSRLQQERRAMAAQTPDPATARAHAAWLRHCDQSLRTLRAEQARQRVRLDAELDRARYEEGRRQALEKLKTQAS